MNLQINAYDHKQSLKSFILKSTLLSWISTGVRLQIIVKIKHLQINSSQMESYKNHSSMLYQLHNLGQVNTTFSTEVKAPYD